MSDDKPLHVRVAEALGCTPKKNRRLLCEWWECTCRDQAHATDGVDGAPREGMSVQGYDTDWGALMPELVRLRIGLMPMVALMSPPLPGTIWVAKEPVSGAWSDNPDPAHAACEVILTLAANGLLKRT